MSEDSVSLERSSSTTLRDVARAAGVSVASVSKVLNNKPGVGNEGRQRVLRAAENLGYLGRSGVAIRTSTQSVTVFTSAAFFTGGQFYDDVFQAIVAEASVQGLVTSSHLLMTTGQEMVSEIATYLSQHSIEAALLLGIDIEPVITLFVEHEIPCVVVNGIDPSMRLDAVLPDNHFAGWLATRFVLEAGHRNVLYVSKPLRLSLRRRFEGFRSAFEHYGVGFEPSKHFVDLEQEKLSEMEMDTLIERLEQRGLLNSITAFICSTDVLALGIMQGLQRRGNIVPDDFSVIGFDDVAIACHSNPPLTTMRVDRDELGREAVSLLIDRCNGTARSTRRVVLGVELVERATVAMPRSR